MGSEQKRRLQKDTEMVQVDVVGKSPLSEVPKNTSCVSPGAVQHRALKRERLPGQMSLNEACFWVPAVHRAIMGHDLDCDQGLDALGRDVVVKAQPLEDDTLHVQGELPDLRWRRSVRAKEATGC